MKLTQLDSVAGDVHLFEGSLHRQVLRDSVRYLSSSMRAAAVALNGLTWHLSQYRLIGIHSTHSLYGLVIQRTNCLITRALSLHQLQLVLVVAMYRDADR